MVIRREESELSGCRFCVHLYIWICLCLHSFRSLPYSQLDYLHYTGARVCHLWAPSMACHLPMLMEWLGDSKIDLSECLRANRTAGKMASRRTNACSCDLSPLVSFEAQPRENAIDPVDGFFFHPLSLGYCMADIGRMEGVPYARIVACLPDHQPGACGMGSMDCSLGHLLLSGYLQ